MVEIEELLKQGFQNIEIAKKQVFLGILFSCGVKGIYKPKLKHSEENKKKLLIEKE